MTMRRTTIIIATLVAAALLAGCRDEEQHPMVLGNGTYTGGGNTPLTAKQVSALNGRVMMQGEENATAGSNESMSEPQPAEIREPNGQPTASGAALNSRVMLQGEPNASAGSNESMSEPKPGETQTPQGQQPAASDKTLDQRLMKQETGGK